MEGKINSMDLANKSKRAQEELSSIRKSVEENLDVLANEASLDYMSKLNADLKVAVEGSDQAKAQDILGLMFSHKESMKVYASLARENVGDYIDSSTGVADMEKFKKELNAFMMETFVIWYGKEGAEKAKIAIDFVDPSKVDYEMLRKNDPSLYGSVTTNKETAGMNHKEKEPKMKILDMREFTGKPRSEVVKAVAEKYGRQYHIPGLEYEKYLLENPDKVPAELKDGNWYYFMGSTLRDQNGSAYVPCVNWNGSELERNADALSNKWSGDDRVVLLEK
jgi:hypothetical protein